MNMLALLKLQRIFEKLAPEAKHAIFIDMLPILSRRLPAALAKDAIEAIRDVLR